MSKSKLSQVKHAFFNNTLKNVDAFSFKDDDFDLDQLRFEFSSLYQLFHSNRQAWCNNPELVFYMSYVCDLLIKYYQTDYVHSNLEELKKQKNEITLFIDQHFSSGEGEAYEKFSEFLLFRLKFKLEAWTHISKVKEYLSSINNTRSRYSYSRSLALHFINYVQKSSMANLIHEINLILGNQISIVDGINFLNQTREISAIIGIILYMIRFLINFSMILKHTFLSMDKAELSPSKVLNQELEKRGFIMASDLVWSVITLLTNYNLFFNITNPASVIVMGAFLVFDAMLLLSMWYFEYLKYQQRIQEMLAQLAYADLIEQAVILKQIAVLKDEWSAQEAYYQFNVLAACIIVISFAVSLVYLTPVALAALALCSMLGNAMYNSSMEYKNYKLSRMAYKREIDNEAILNDDHHKQLMATLDKEVNEKFEEFCKSLFFNVGGVAFIITVAVASWPIAICLASLYIGHQLISSYEKQRPGNAGDKIEHDVYRHMLVM